MTTLSGVKIIELAGIGPASFCGMMLADHGAEVIRVEGPGAPEDAGMIAGMWTIIAGIGVAAYGLLPRDLSRQMAASSGLLLVALGAFIPESAKFLTACGRHAEAQRVMAQFGSAVRKVAPADVAVRGRAAPLSGRAFAGKLTALSLVAVSWGLVNFGLLLWLPVELVARGYSMKVSSGLLASSALIAVPTVFLVAWIYSAWRTKYALLLATAASLLLIARLGRETRGRDLRDLDPDGHVFDEAGS